MIDFLPNLVYYSKNKEAMNLKKIASFFCVMFVLLFALAGCGDEKTTNTSNTVKNSAKEDSKVNVDYVKAAEKQMAMPEVGETIAIFHIQNYGEVKVKFFEKIAPKAVENFVTHAKEGYYNGVIFHRVINEFMIQGGDPEGTGMGGESIWGEDFAEELSLELVPYRGSLCMASRGLQNSPSLGSQFFITQRNYSDQMVSYLKSYGYPEELIEQYKKYGGDVLSLYRQYTVFGQVYEGMEIVDKIATVATDAMDKPIEDVVIESIEVRVME